MKIKRQKAYANIVTDAQIGKQVAREVAKGTEYLKKHSVQIKLLHPKKRVSIFSEGSSREEMGGQNHGGDV